MKTVLSWFREKKRILLFGLLAGLGITLGYYFIWTPKGPISEFSEQRDAQDVIKIIRDNWDWLISSQEFNPEFMIKYRAPYEDPYYIGRLRMGVLREKNDFVGFTAYFLEEPTVGRVLFVAVKKEFRGKRYGQQLVEYALNALKKMGAKQAVLVTRPDNFSAQKLYERVGFIETKRDEQFVYYTYYYNLNSL